MSDALFSARSGLQASSVRLRNSAHNVANIATPNLKNHRTETFHSAVGAARHPRASTIRPATLITIAMSPAVTAAPKRVLRALTVPSECLAWDKHIRYARLNLGSLHFDQTYTLCPGA